MTVSFLSFKGLKENGTDLSPPTRAQTPPPSLPSTKATQPIPQDKLLTRVAHYETQIVSQFRNAVVETGRAAKMGEVKKKERINFFISAQPPLFFL